MPCLAFFSVATTSECLLHLSCAYVHGCLLFSLLAVTGKGRRHSFSGNVRRSPGRREREESSVLFSLVAAGRREGATWPWENSCRIFAPFIFSLHRSVLSLSLFFTVDLFDAKRRYLPSYHLPASRTHIGGLPTRVSSVPFCVVN